MKVGLTVAFNYSGTVTMGTIAEIKTWSITTLGKKHTYPMFVIDRMYPTKGKSYVRSNKNLLAIFEGCSRAKGEA